MLQAAIQEIKNLAVKAARIDHLPELTNARNNFMEVDGAIVAQPIAPPLRRQTCDTLEALVDRTKVALADGGKPEIWHADERVELMMDRHDRREWAALHNPWSDPFGVLLGWAASGKPAVFDQPGLIKLLRHTLDQSTALTAPFRAMNWRATSETDGVIAPGSEKLGQSIQREMAGAENVLDRITVRVPVYTLPGLSDAWEIELAVYLDLANHQIELSCLPCELNNAIGAAHITLDGILLRLLGDEATKQVDIYQGKPGCCS